MLKIPQTDSENRNMKIKISNLIFLLLFVLCNISILNAQYDAPPQPPPPPPADYLKNINRETVKKVKYFFIFQIDAESKVTLSVQDSEYIDGIGTIADTTASIGFFEDLKNSGVEKSNPVKTKIDPSIIVKADENLNYGILVNFLQKARNLSDNQVKIFMSKKFYNPYIFVQKKPKRDDEIKPNPLFLYAEIKPDKKVTLNNEEFGSLEDLSRLTNTLVQGFKERENVGAFREGTNEVEKTVFIKAPSTMQFSEIIKLVAALKDSGAQPIELQIDDLQ